MGTTKTLPTDWTVWKVGSSHSSWSSSIAASGTSNSVAAMTQITSSPVTSALLDSSITTSTRNASAYNIAHAATSTDRVLSTSPTGITGNALQLSLTNNTGSALSSVAISYDIVKFYDGNKQSSLESGYPVGEETAGLSVVLQPGQHHLDQCLGAQSGQRRRWHPSVYSAGTVNNNGVTGPVDYNVTSISNASLTFASAWGVGPTLKLRWVDDNAINISPDQIIGLNNVRIAAVPDRKPTPCSWPAWACSPCVAAALKHFPLDRTRFGHRPKGVLIWRPPMLIGRFSLLLTAFCWRRRHRHRA